MKLFKTKQEKLNNRFYKACQKGNVAKAKAAISDGADVNGFSTFNDHQYLPAPHYAARCGHPEMINLLMDSGRVNVDLQNQFGLTPLMVTHYAKEKAVAAANALLEHGANINAQNHIGNTALHFAAGGNNLALVSFLLEKGADPCIKNKENMTASAIAYTTGYRELALLIDAHERKKEALTKQAPPPTAGWSLSAPDEVIFVEDKPAIGYRLTSIFNFTERKYLNIARNISGAGGESQTFKLFEEFADTRMVEKAYEELIRLGGSAPPPFVAFKKIMTAS